MFICTQANQNDSSTFIVNKGLMLNSRLFGDHVCLFGEIDHVFVRGENYVTVFLPGKFNSDARVKDINLGY